eukprot:4549-Heterococcus_DN1.PRE.1
MAVHIAVGILYIHPVQHCALLIDNAHTPCMTTSYRCYTVRHCKSKGEVLYHSILQQSRACNDLIPLQTCPDIFSEACEATTPHHVANRYTTLCYSAIRGSYTVELVSVIPKNGNKSVSRHGGIFTVRYLAAVLSYGVSVDCNLQLAYPVAGSR